MRYFVFLLLISINAVSLSAKGRTSGSVTLRDSLVQYAKTLINTPYLSGSKGPSGFDCSGYTSYVYGKFGMSLNSSSGSQVTNGQEVDVDNLKKGDLVFFKGHNSKKSRIGHVGIFLDRNDDGSFNFIHSANGGGVRIDNSNSGYYAKRYVTGCSVITGKKLYKFDPVQVKSFSDYDNTVQYASTGTTHKVRKGESLYTIAQKYNVSEEQLKEWNNLNGNKIKPGQKLSIQSEKSIGTKNNVSAESKIALAKNGEKTHTVKKGESFYTIAKKYHISEEELIKANSDVEGKLKPGQKIRISTGGSNASSANNGAKQEEPATKTVASRQTHKVKKGETLSEIAEKYHTTSAQLKRLNGLSSNKLKPGTTLTVQIAEKEVPVKEAKTETASKPTKKEVVANEEEQASKTVTSRKSHKVRKGETLSEIADKYGVSVKQLKRWNGLSKNKVKPGTYLTVQMTEKEVPVKEAKSETASKPTKKEVVSNEEEQASKTVTSRKTHKVRKGETLSEIANKYGVSVKQLKHWNGISKNKVKPGTYLTVQMTEKQVTVAQPSKPEPEAKNNQPVEKEETAENTHVVAKGETLYSIAKSHHLSAIKLKEINSLTDNQVHEGDVLSLDSNTPAPKAKEAATPIA